MRNYNRRQIRRRSININTPKIYREKLPLKTVFFRVVLLGFFLTLFYFIFLSGKFSIKEITIIGNSRVEYAEIEKIVNNQINSGSTLSKIFSTNVIFTSKKAINESILKQNLYVRDVKVSKKAPNKLVVEIIERAPIMLWETGGKTYLIDQDGIVLDEKTAVTPILEPANAELEPEIFQSSLPRVIDEKNIPVEIGKVALNAKFIAFVVSLNDQFSTKTELTISNFTVSESTFDLRAHTDTGLVVIFDTTRKPDTQVDNVKRAIDHANNAKKKINEYVDVRISGKIFYR